MKLLCSSSGFWKKGGVIRNPRLPLILLQAGLSALSQPFLLVGAPLAPPNP
jgi:hypothetical protein